MRLCGMRHAEGLSGGMSNGVLSTVRSQGRGAYENQPSCVAVKYAKNGRKLPRRKQHTNVRRATSQCGNRQRDRVADERVRGLSVRKAHAGSQLPPGASRRLSP
jgi:hypothetical protein